MRALRVLPGAVAAALLVSGCAGTSAGTVSQEASSAGYHGVEPTTPYERPDFVLRDTSGNRFDFAEETAGKPTLLYFGYTNCPDECPTAMADIATALRQTPADLRDEVEVVFITTDPERDTPPAVRRFLEQFSTRIVGLVGDDAEVAKAQEAVGIPPAERGGDVPTLPGKPDQHAHEPGTADHEHFGPLGYAVSHANVIFAYDADDALPVVYPGGVTPADIAADLPLLASPPDSSDSQETSS